MSALWHAEVLELEPGRALIRLEVVHPDAGPFFETASFALSLLAEKAHDVDLYGSFRPLGTLGGEFRPDDVESESWRLKNAPRFVESVRALDPLPSMGAANAAYDGNWQYPKGSAVRYEIKTRDPRWVDHLEVGQRWQSTIFV